MASGSPCRLLCSSPALALPSCGPQIPWVASWAIPGPETLVWGCVFLASHLYFSPMEPALDGPLGSVVQLISGGMPPLPLVLQGQTSTAAAFPSSWLGQPRPPDPAWWGVSNRLPPTQDCSAEPLPAVSGQEKAECSWQVLILAAKSATDWPELLL